MTNDLVGEHFLAASLTTSACPQTVLMAGYRVPYNIFYNLKYVRSRNLNICVEIHEIIFITQNSHLQA